MKLKYSIITILMFCVVSDESVPITWPKTLNLMTIGTNSEEVIDENAFKDLHDFNFPDVTYPTSILELCQPFYFNSNSNGLDAIVGPFSSEVKSNYMSLLSKDDNKKTSSKIPALKDEADYVCQLITDVIIDDKAEFNADTIEVLPEVNIISSELAEILSTLYNDKTTNTSLNVDKYSDIYLVENIPEVDINDDLNNNSDENEPEKIEKNIPEEVNERALDPIEEYVDYLMKSDNTYTLEEITEHIEEVEEKLTELSNMDIDHYLLNTRHIDVNLSEIFDEYIDLYENLNNVIFDGQIHEPVIYEIDHYLNSDNSDTIEPVYNIVNDDIYHNSNDYNTDVFVQEFINEDIDNDFNLKSPKIEIEELKTNNESIDDYNRFHILNSANDPNVAVMVQESINEDVDNDSYLNSPNIEIEELEIENESIGEYNKFDNHNSVNDSNLDVIIQKYINEDVDNEFNSNSPKIRIEELKANNETLDDYKRFHIYNSVNDSNVDVIVQESVNEDVDNYYNLNSSNIEIEELETDNESIGEYKKCDNHNSVNDSNVDIIIQKYINEDMDNDSNSNSPNIETNELQTKNESINDCNKLDNHNSVSDFNVDVIVKEFINEDNDNDFNLSSPNLKVEEIETNNENINNFHKFHKYNYSMDDFYVDTIVRESINENFENLNNTNIKKLEPKIENIDDYNTFDNHNNMDEFIKVDDGIVTIPKEAVVFDVIYKDGYYLEKPLLDIVPSNIPVRLKINIEICKDEFSMGDSNMKEINEKLQTFKTFEDPEDFNDCKENIESVEGESVTEEQITILDEINESDFISALSILLLDSLNNKPLEITTPEIFNTQCNLNTSISDVSEYSSNDYVYSEDLVDKLDSKDNEKVEMHDLFFSAEDSIERFTSPHMSILSPKSKIITNQEIANNNSDNLQHLIMSNIKSVSSEYKNESTELIEMCPLLSLLHKKAENSSKPMEKVLCKSQEVAAEIIDLESSIEDSEEKELVKYVDPVETWPLIDVFQLRIKESYQTSKKVLEEKEVNTE